MKYDVIKVMKVYPSRSNKDEVVFKDNNGKMYFLAKSEKSKGVKPEIHKRYLVWVIKESEKVGYVKLNIDGVLIRDYIDNIANLEVSHYFNDIATKDQIRFSNDMHNWDVSYALYNESDAIFTDEDMSKMKAYRHIDKYVNEHGISSEKMEFYYELAHLEAYLYKLFNITGYGSTKGKNLG